MRERKKEIRKKNKTKKTELNEEGKKNVKKE